MTEEPDNLVDFPADPDAVEISIGRHRMRTVTCRHRRVYFTESETLQGPDGRISTGGRRVFCRDCDETLDAFEVMKRYAANDDKLRRQVQAWNELDAAWVWLWKEKGSSRSARQGSRLRSR